jgi:hypothetical protein
VTAKRTTTSVCFSLYVNRDKGTRVQAFQFPEDDLAWVKKVWKQPTAVAGDWLVKTGFGTVNITYRLYSDNNFTRIYSRPESGR